jgi:hypothetical protein
VTGVVTYWLGEITFCIGNCFVLVLQEQRKGEEMTAELSKRKKEMTVVGYSKERRRRRDRARCSPLFLYAASIE